MAVVRADASHNSGRCFLIPTTKKERHSSCVRKAKYATEADARKYGLRSLTANPAAGALYPYGCSLCRRWHLTRTENGTRPVTL